MNVIRDAYISVEICDRGLDQLREGLSAILGQCEVASSAAHVSIAYGEGDVEIEALDRVASEIAALPFSVCVAGFEILEGGVTPYDYLVVELEGDSFGAAKTCASSCMKTREFAGGFRSHVSLLKFPKGAVSLEWARGIVAEMNASHTAALALGRRVVLAGSTVSVYSSDRQRRLSKSFAA